MVIPEIVYHGAFWPESIQPAPDRLSTKGDYIYTSSRREWARFFALSRRWRYREQPGLLVIYEIDTKLLPEEVIGGAIPPDGRDRTLNYEWLRKLEDKMMPERIKVGEWR